MDEPEPGRQAPISMVERSDVGALALRLDDEAAVALGRVAALSLPSAINRASTMGAIRSLRLGPDEYLLVMPQKQVPATQAALDRALDGQHHALVDLSARFVTIELEGAPVRDTLAAACPLDLHPAVIGPNDATRTLLGKAEIVLDCLGPNHFRLLVNRSLGPYLRGLLTVAGREHGLAAAPA